MKLSIVAGTIVGALALTTPALAAPVTVTLRIEGATQTLYEAPVTTDTGPFVADDGPHACGTVPTRGAVISAAAQSGALRYTATWNAGFGSPTFTTVAGQDVTYDAGTGRYLGEYKNWVSSDDGSCGDPVANGDEVLFAYAAFGDVALKLSGPATAKPGESVTLKVTDGGGAAVAGASVDGKTTGADGNVVVGPYERGDHPLKATKSGSIRSNAVNVCVTDGTDGFCGTSGPKGPPAQPTPTPTPGEPDRTPPVATLATFKSDHQTFKTGPRELRGSFNESVRTVKLRLTKRAGGKCWYFSGKAERFRRVRCGKGSYFAIGDRADWSYLLPSRLTKGRYVLDAIAIDQAGNRTPLRRGTTRVVFTVR